MNYAIIAAGEGSRLAQEGVKLPKPLVNLNGTPMIKRLIDIFMRCNATSLSIIVNEEMHQVREYLESLDIPVPFKLVVKSTPSSMHSFYEVSRHFTDGKFCLTTVDTIFHEEEFKKYIEAFENDTTGADGYMAVPRLSAVAMCFSRRPFRLLTSLIFRFAMLIALLIR